AAADPERDGIDEAAAWPLGTETSWGAYRTDGAVHATYWIASWPRIDVGAAWGSWRPPGASIRSRRSPAAKRNSPKGTPLSVSPATSPSPRARLTNSS